MSEIGVENKLKKPVRSDFEKHELTVKKKTIDKMYNAHWHDYFEIKLILSGDGTVIINGEKHTFKGKPLSDNACKYSCLYSSKCC